MLFWLADVGGMLLVVGLVVLIVWHERLKSHDPVLDRKPFEHTHEESGCVRVMYPPLRAVPQPVRVFDWERDA